MIKCIIVDDEPLAQEVLESHIQQTKQLTLIGKCSNALEAFQLLQSHTIDLMFLDIEMPAVSGIGFLKALKNPPAVVFTTAFADYALTGFELEAVDYLLKPITYARFQKSIYKLLKYYPHEQPQPKSHTYFKVSGKLIKVMHADLRYVQSVKDYILLNTTQGNYLTHMTMKFLTELLPTDNFVRVHRSYLINKNCITTINRAQLSIGNEVIPIGENYREFLDSVE
jgi:two-component system LytT family response regulator